jgi:hypothetical protein
MKVRLVSLESLMALLMLAAAGAGGACMGGEPATGPSSGKGGSSGSGKGGSGGSSTTGGGGSSTTGGGGSSSTTGGGGATGSGGVVTTGTGGSGPACATKTTPMSPVLIDFETYDGMKAASDFNTAFGGTAANMGSAYTGPYGYGDPMPTLSIMAGHPPSQWAVAEMGTATTTTSTSWGVGGGFWMGCTNATAFKGVSFWVRGTAPAACTVPSPTDPTMTTTAPCFSFTLVQDATADAASGGMCTSSCAPAKKADIPLSMDWTQVKLMWSDFAPGTSGNASITPNGDNITGFGWSVPLAFGLAPGATDPTVGPYIAQPGTITINIDDVQFIP